MPRFYLFALFIFVACSALVPRSYAQQQQRFELGLGAKAALLPQAGLHLYPTEHLELGLQFFTDGRFDRMADNFFLALKVLGRRETEERVFARFGAELTYVRSYGRTVLVGPVFGFDYGLSDRLRVFADLTFGLNVDVPELTMTNTGVGLVYRIR
jgi:hypothetical protein